MEQRLREIINPYNPHRLPDSKAAFFGREDFTVWLEQQLIARRRVFIFHGPPKIGKTTYLHFLPELLSTPQIAASFPFSKILDLSVNALLIYFLQTVTEQFIEQGLIRPEQLTTAADPVSGVNNLLLEVQKDQPDARFLFLFDDFDQLLTLGPDKLTTFLNVCQALIAEQANLNFVLTCRDTALPYLKHPILDTAPTKQMTPLKANEAIQMITRPVEGVIRFDYGVTNRIAELTSNHPYYLSLFNQVLFNRYAREGWVNLRHMDETLETVLRMELPAFDGVWDEATAIERAVLTAMASFKGVHGVFSQQDIMPLFLRRTREADEKVIITALESLSFRGVLVRMGALSYRFFVDLFRSWVQEYYDFETALAEVVWSNPARRSEQATVSRSEPTGESPSSQQGMRGQWPVWLIGLGGVTVLGIVILALILLLGDSPDDPATSQFVEGALAGEVVSFTTSTPGTPTVTLAPEPTTTATPTPPLVVSRLLPSIAYMARQTQQGDQEEALPWQIYVMNIDGSNATSVSDLVANDTTPVWSPDGSKLVFVSQRDGNRELYVMDVSGHNLLNLTNHPANDWTPTWSPDGTKIVFSSDRTRAWELYAIDADGNNLQQLTNDQAGNISPVWSPDGQYIAFSSKRDGNWEIYRMRIDGSDLRRLTNNDSNDLAPVWSYSGDLIAYETNVEGNVEIYVMTSAGGNPRNISRLPYANDHGPVWSPDDKRLVFYSNREGNWDLFSVELDGSDAVNLTNTPDIDEQTPAWRP